MHGREGEQQSSHRRHMWPVPASATSSIDFTRITTDSFSKDGRKICVGDCALFKPLQDSPPFVGIIRRLILDKEDYLSLYVSWLYRPADVKLAKGALLEAAPNEVFYSFHKDEIPAASLLHPCKVAFLRKGVELPSGISSFVCRRVYDIENKCLWWLTDQDYVKERQVEVDQLLEKTREEMYGAVQSGGRSPKTLNGPAGATQLKPSSDSGQNSSSSYPTQAKGKKRELGVQGPDSVKRERTCRADDADSGQLRPEHTLKHEIAKITDRGGLVDFEGVEKLVQLMQSDNSEKKLDLACRIMLANVIAVTDRFECLTRFVQLRGLPVLDDWLQQVHKGKIGDASSPKEGDKSVDEFLLALLRALDKLPVNLHALQNCNIGKSVNHLRTHKNSEIQKKARSLVDTWKKRVEAEMNMIDSKSGSSRGGSWPTKSVISEVSNVVGRRNGGSSELGVKNSTIQSCSSKTPPAGKPGSGDKVSTVSPVSSKLLTVTVSGIAASKELSSAALAGSGSPDLPLTTIKEEKSSSSSQSQNNSQSCSSDYGKAVSCREDARSSTAGSMSVNKISSSVSRSRKTSNGLHGTAATGVQKENSFGKHSSTNRSLASEKVLPTGVMPERNPDGHLLDNGNNQRLIVRLPSTGRSPSCSASGGSPEDVSATSCKGSPHLLPEKLENQDLKVKGRNETARSNSAVNAKMEIYQRSDGLGSSDEAKLTSAGVHFDDQNRHEEGSDKLTEASKSGNSPPGMTVKSGKTYEASFISINALVDSCAKFSEASVTPSVGDDVGMNLLASVAAGEISRSDVSRSSSSERKSPVPEDSCSGNDTKLKQIDEDRAQSEDPRQCNEGLIAVAPMDHGSSINGSSPKTGHNDVHVGSSHRSSLVGCDEKTEECDVKLDSAVMLLPHIGNGQVKTSDGNLPELVRDDSAALLTGDDKKEVDDAGDESDEFQEQRKLGDHLTIDHNASNFKLNVKIAQSDEVKNIICADEKSEENSVAGLPEVAAMSAKVEGKADEESPSCSSSGRGKEDKKAVNTLSGSYNSKQQTSSDIICPKTEDSALPCDPCTDSGKESKIELINETKSVSHRLGIGSSFHGNGHEISRENIGKEELSNFHPGGSSFIESPALPVQETEQPIKTSGFKSDGAEEMFSRNNIYSVTAAGPDTTVKLDFDLNEGLPVDDGSLGELVKLPISGNLSSHQLPCPIPISNSSMPGHPLPSSITVAAAAKGPFVPPENPLRIKSELGWKGSAATSAFRPAEPRKILDMPLSTVGVTIVGNSQSNHRRPLLDFDLNVPDQRILEEAAPQNSMSVTCSGSGYCESSGGGLNLDLNRCDESPETGQLSVSNSSKLDFPKLPGRAAVSGGLFIAESNTSRGFDLNNGPCPDEVGSEAAPPARNSASFLSLVPTVRVNNMEVGNMSSWFPGTSFSTLGMPPVLPGRGEQYYPILPASSSQRILGQPGNTSYGPDIYRGPVLSSSPAVGFPPSAAFQYPGFPFETNFPLSSNSYSGVSSPYVDSSSAGPHGFPAVPSQLMGPTGMVSTHYPRPYVMSIPGGSNNVPEARKWGNQSLDLNSGPGVTDVDRRDEKLPSALRQLPFAGSQCLPDEQMKMYQMAGGVIKRKEPDGGWDGGKISHKHPPWQ